MKDLLKEGKIPNCWAKDFEFILKKVVRKIDYTEIHPLFLCE